MLRKKWMMLAATAVMATGTACRMKENMAARATREQSDKQQDTKEQAVKAQTPEQKETGSYPEKDVTFIVPFSTGDGADALMHMVGVEVERMAGHASTINNMPGNRGAVGTAELVKATPDGYTIAGTSAYDVLGSVFLGGDSVRYTEASFKYIYGVSADGEIFIANPSTGFESIEEMAEFAQEHPGELTVSASGVTHNLLLRILEDQLGVKVTNIVYLGGGDSFNMLMGNHVGVALTGKRFTSQVEGTDFRVLCVMAPGEIASLLGVPALCNAHPEVKPSVDSRLITAPKDMPGDVAERLELLIKEATGTEELRNKMVESGDLYQFTAGGEVEAALAEAGKTLKAAMERNPTMFGLE